MIARRCGVSFSQMGKSGKRIHIVNLRLGATSTTRGSLLGLDLRRKYAVGGTASLHSSGVDVPPQAVLVVITWETEDE